MASTISITDKQPLVTLNKLPVIQSISTDKLSFNFNSRSFYYPSHYSSSPCKSAENHLIIIDSGIEDYHTLLLGIIEDATVLVLEGDRDGIQQITEVLHQHSPITHLHIISHGSPGCLHLGNAQLSLTTLNHYAKDLKTWFQSSWQASQSSPPSLLLYGCSVAAGNAGAALIDQLYQLTGAELAASTTPTGNTALGGNWNFETRTGNVNVAVPFSQTILAAYPFLLVTPIDTNGLIASYEDLPDDTSGDYSAPELRDIDNDGDPQEDYTYQFTIGNENNLNLSGFTASPSGGTSEVFDVVQLTENILLRRIDNVNVNDGSTTDATVFERNILLYEQQALDENANILSLKPPRIDRMEEGLLSGTINRGADNLFSNADSPNINNIERVDFVVSGGFSAPSANLNDIGFLLLERGGNDPLLVAAITDIDANGNPTAFGTLVNVPVDAWGISQFNLNTAVMTEVNPGENPRFSGDLQDQVIAGIYISFNDFGITPDQTFFGYSIFPGDIDETNDLVSLTDFPLDTSGVSGVGGLDLVAGGGAYIRRNAGNVAPVINLDPNNLTGGANDRNYGATSVNGGTINVTAPRASGFDPNNAGQDIELLTIQFAGLVDPATEILTIGGVAVPLTTGTTAATTVDGIPFNIAVSGDRVTLTRQAGGDITNDTVSALLRSTTYTNTATTPVAGDRIFRFTANDGVVDGNTATSTITVTAPTIPPVAGGIRPERLNGYSDIDQLIGTPERDIINAGSSADVIRGNGGDDALNGGSGNDDMEGGSGNDALNGGSGSDRMAGNQGNDTLNGGNGNDLMRGNEGDDLLTGGNGRDRLFGNDGDDRLRGNRGNDLIGGGTGADQLTGGQGRDRFAYRTASEFGDVITDFEIIKDRINLRRVSGINSIADLRFRQRGEDAIVQGQTGSGFRTIAILEDVQASTLDNRHFLF